MGDGVFSSLSPPNLTRLPVPTLSDRVEPADLPLMNNPSSSKSEPFWLKLLLAPLFVRDLGRSAEMERPDVGLDSGLVEDMGRVGLGDLDLLGLCEPVRPGLGVVALRLLLRWAERALLGPGT
jgi:hypothetical protein